MNNMVWLAAAVAALAPAPATVAVPRFDAVALQGGGTVLVRPGPNQRDTLLRGSSAVSRLEVRGRSLEVRACARRCPPNYRLDLEIVVPDLQALAIEGGGSIRLAPGFPARDKVAAAVRGGGSIDMVALRARVVSASVQGGGWILVQATDQLAAAVQGGGSISYRGNPRVSSAISGGGSVQRAGA